MNHPDQHRRPRCPRSLLEERPSHLRGHRYRTLRGSLPQKTLVSVGRFHDPATGQFLSVAGRVHRTAIRRSDVSSDEPRELGELGRTM